LNTAAIVFAEMVVIASHIVDFFILLIILAMPNNIIVIVIIVFRIYWRASNRASKRRGREIRDSPHSFTLLRNRRRRINRYAIPCIHTKDRQLMRKIFLRQQWCDSIHGYK
jgi:hypothetical protein